MTKEERDRTLKIQLAIYDMLLDNTNELTHRERQFLKDKLDGVIAPDMSWPTYCARAVCGVLVLLLALSAAACGTPTAPTRTQIGRNVDGTPHYLGDPYQPWYDTNVTPRDPKTGSTIQHPPTP